jgi:NAD(P)-dependent dehydrogenase (short-subunit alcohol dehydrogenase family)
VSSPESVAVMVRRAVGAFKQIHILHNNAAKKPTDLKAFFERFEDYSPAVWRDIMSVNLDGMFLVAQAVGKQMVKQKTGGSIIQRSSIYGFLGPDNRIYEGSSYLGRKINSPAVYAASKAAVLGLTTHLATYWGRQGIRVNSISPGGVESGQNKEFTQRYSARVPMARMATADELVGALIYLASDASSYVTGQNLVVDGGLSAW